MYLDIMIDECKKLVAACEQRKSMEEIRDIESSIVSAAMLASGYEWDTNTDTYVVRK